MIMILCKSSVMPVTNNAATHHAQEKEKHAREDTHRRTILEVRVKSVGEERDKLFACAFVTHRVFTRLRCCILTIFSEYCGKMREIRTSDSFFNELFYDNQRQRETESGSKKGIMTKRRPFFLN